MNAQSITSGPPQQADGEFALDHVLVVECGVRVAAGVCGSLLQQLGATVVAVESEPVAGFSDDKGRHRDQLMPGKLSLPNGDADAHLLADLLARADVIVRSPDADPPHGPSFSHAASDQVDCTITAFGATADSPAQPPTDLQIQALCGIVDTTGMPDGAPVALPLPIVEYMTGIYAASAIIAALRVRRATGVGQSIDMALFDCAFAAMATFLPKVIEGAADVRRVGNRHSMAAPFNAFQARDGWLILCTTNDEQWRRLCQVIEQPALGLEPRFASLADRIRHVAEIDACVQGWCGVRTVSDCLGRLSAVNLACGAVAPVDGFPREPNLEHRRMIGQIGLPGGGTIVVPNSPLRMSRTPGRATRDLTPVGADRDSLESIARLPRRPFSRSDNLTAARLPLDGIRVIEIGHYTTAPLAAKQLASLGADVIKIEPPEGEATRGWLPGRRGQGYFFTYTNSDKRAIVLDLASAPGAEEFGQFLASADVLIENLKPGTLARRGFAPADIERRNPRLVYCAISGFGVDSLYPGRPAVDTVIQATSGFMDLIRADGVPVKSGISSADLLGAQMALLAVLAALEYRDRTGSGQWIDLAMQDIAAWATQLAWNGPAAASPPAMLAARDGFVVARLPAEALSRTATGGEGQPGEQSALSRDELSARLCDSGIEAAPVLTAVEAARLDWVRERRMWIDAPDSAGQVWPLMASPLRLLGTPPRVARPIEKLDADGPAIRAEWRAIEARRASAA